MSSRDERDAGLPNYVLHRVRVVAIRTIAILVTHSQPQTIRTVDAEGHRIPATVKMGE